MQLAVSRRTAIALLCACLAIATGTGAALAQSGSAGGSIGNDEKSLSGSRETPRSVEPDRPRRSKPDAAEPRRAARRSGGNSFDGAWAVVSVGCGGTSTGAVVVSNGRIIGQGVTGTVSPSGAVSSIGNYDGIIVTSSGRTSGNSGAGSFRRSDGCTGSWTSSKQ